MTDDGEDRVRRGLSALADAAQLPAALTADTVLRRGRRRRITVISSALFASAVVVATVISVPLAVTETHHTPAVKPAVIQSPRVLTVPDVTLQPLAAAIQTMTAAGFEVQVTRTSGLEPLGVVIYESPAAGSQSTPGTTVTLTVSAGPESATPAPSTTAP